MMISSNVCLDVLLLEHGGPATYKQATTDTDSKKWHEAIRSEMDYMFEKSSGRLDKFARWGKTHNEQMGFQTQN